jgi:opacity protein-like surface antigen
MKKSNIAILTAASLLAAPAFAQDLMSQNFIKGGDETLTLNLGGILNQFDTTLQLNGSGTSGSTLNLEGNGLSKSLTSFEASGTWRFLSRNRIDILYFESKRSGSRTLDREVTIDGTVIPVNFTLAADAKNAFVLADYRYSFVKTPQVEVAGALGFYGGQFKYNLNATGIRDGQPVEVAKTASTTVPLPLIGVTLDWYINPRWKVSGNVAGMKAQIGDVDGTAVVAGAATEFMLTRNVGLGLAYMYSDLDVDVTKGGFDGNLTWQMNSLRAYAQLKF